MSAIKKLKILVQRDNSLVFITLVCIVSALLQLGSVLLIAPIINNATNIKGEIIVYNIVIFLVIFFLNSIVKYIRVQIFKNISTDINKSLVDIYVDSILSKDFIFFDEYSSGDILTILNNDIRKINHFLTSNLELLFYQPVLLLFSFIAAMLIDPIIGGLVIIVIILSSILNIRNSESLIKYSNDINKTENKLISFEKEVVEQYEYIKASKIEDYILNIHNKKLEDRFLAEDTFSTIKQKSYRPALINEYMPKILIILLVIYPVYKNKISYGEFIVLLSLVQLVSLPFSKFLRALVSLKSIIPMTEDLEKFIFIREDRGCDIDLLNCEGKNVITFDNVDFYYVEGKEIISSFNLDVYDKDKIAILGKSGSGKTTLIKLILGMYRPVNGEVKVFGVDAYENRKKLWKNISYVSSDDVLLDGDIIYNITLLDRDIEIEEKERLDNIIKRLNLETLVEDKKNQLIEQFGKNLSGGEKLKISLARALFKNSQLLIMDEPTSALDKESEMYLIELLKQLEMTIVLITHRKTTASCCDRTICI